MRVCIVTHNVSRGDGQGRVNYEIVKNLLRSRIPVRVIATHVDAAMAGEVTWHRVVPPRVPTRLLKNQWFALGSAAALPAARGEVIHMNGFVTWPASHVNTAHMVHSCWRRSAFHPWAQKRDAYGAYHLANSRLNGVLERRAYAQARRVVAVSAKVRGELIRYCAVPPDKIQVIANGVDCEEFVPGTVDRRTLGLPHARFLALFVGDIRSRLKNLDTVLRAVMLRSDVCLAVAGDSAQSPYPEEARRLGIADRVSFLGFRRDVPQLMRAADAFVFPSHYEACSLAVSEAMASGLPVVTAPTVGCFHEITHLQDGLLMRSESDPRELAALLGWLLDNPGEAKAIGRRARAVAEAHSFAAMAHEYLALYEAAWSFISTGRTGVDVKPPAEAGTPP